MSLDTTDKAYLTIKWRDNDRPGITNERVIDCGVVGDTDCFRSERRMGIYRGRQYTIRITDPRPIILIAAEEEVEVMPW